MTRTLLALALLASSLSPALAGTNVWAVPGIINNGLATVLSCTNGDAVPASVTATIFTRAGVQNATATAPSIAAGATVNFATQPVAVLGIPDSLNINLATSVTRGGSAKITAPSKVYCSAYIADPVGDPPTVGWQLNIVKKTSQKGD